MNLKLEILRMLDCGSDSLLFPAPTILNQMRVVVKPAPTFNEFNQALRELDAGGLVIGIRDGLDANVVKYKLTDAGKARLAEYR